MNKITTIKALIFSMGLISFQSFATDCKKMEGKWEGTGSSQERPYYSLNYTVLIQNEKLFIPEFTFIVDGHQMVEKNLNVRCSIQGNQLKLIIDFNEVTSTEFINLSKDYMSYEGSWSNTGGGQGFSRVKRISALPKSTLTGEAAKSCIVKKDSTISPTYTLQNICNDSVNLKYTFDRSKPFAGTYVTLQPKQETFETANLNEKYKFLACIFPGVPTAINGKCK